MQLSALITVLLGTYASDPNIKFHFYDARGELSYTSEAAPTDNLGARTTCTRWAPVTVVVHGYLESCSQLWVQQLVRNLNNRTIGGGGCVLCMDYSPYAQVPQFAQLYEHFDLLVGVLKQKLEQFAAQGFPLSKVRVIGFSFGAVVALKAGELLGPLSKLAKVDAIDPVNPALDTAHKFASDPRRSARHVQCVHCSTDNGTPVHDACHEDWVMGDCGIRQAAASAFPYGPHGLCPYFYVYGMPGTGNAAFVARPRPVACTADAGSERLATSGFGVQRMGFKAKWLAGNGTYFADTFRCPPYSDESATNCQSTVPRFPL